MGYMRHHAIIVTTWHEARAEAARGEAVGVFAGRAPVSPLLASPINGYWSFMVGPDGSKQGWSDSDRGDEARDALVAWLHAQRYEDGSSAFSWVEVQYGDDNGDTRVVRDSDAPRRERWYWYTGEQAGS